MNTHHPIHNPRVRLGVAVLLITVLVVGCHEFPVAPDAGDQAATEAVTPSKKCGNPPCGGGNGEGGETGFTVAMTGGGVTPEPPQEFDTFTDKTNGANAIIGGTVSPFAVQFNLTATKAYSETPGNTCDFECDASNPNLDCPAIRQSLEANLVTSDPVLVGGINTGFDKNNALNATTGDCPTFTAMGSAEDGKGMVRWRNCYVSYSDGDADPSNDATTINDATLPRTFTLEADLPGTSDWENTVDTFKRVDSNGDGDLGASDDLVSLRCPLQPGDEVSTTIAPKQ